LPPAIPFTDQLTAVFEVPLTVAVNCLVWPPATLAVVGETLTLTEVGAEAIETEELADLLLSATLVALTVTEPPEGTEAGALYMPVDETVP
jgi:hypothetical protein